MLVILSDLHFCDGTATPENVAPAAFQLVLGELYELARRNGVDELDLVFLGDIFDLLRTERWFEVDAATRPWGDPAALDGAPPAPAVLDHALAIARDVAARNADAFRALRGEGLAAPKRVRRIYLPGNHDRLYLVDDRLRRLVRDTLGAEDETALAGDGIFPHRIESPRYQLLARHGHEWDAWNFERHDPTRAAADYTDGDYLPAPIGDAITTELVARLPRELRARLADTVEFRGRPELDEVHHRMQRIEDVRPLWASFRWMFYEADRLSGRLDDAQARALRHELTGAVQTLSRDFARLPFYRAWHERHHARFHVDAADQLQTLLDGLDLLRADWVGSMVSWFQRLFGGLVDQDDCLAGAAREPLERVGREELRFVVYGHTHEPLQAPLRAAAARDLYLNSGTFRRREFQTRDKHGFVGWDLLTYLVFYDADEAKRAWGGDGPAFEVWDGARS